MQSFRGEGDLMVDAFRLAGGRQSNGGQPMPGYGRDLVPFFDDDGNEAGGRASDRSRGPRSLEEDQA